MLIHGGVLECRPKADAPRAQLNHNSLTAKNRMHIVYILHSAKLKKRYIGQTKDLAQRLKSHLTGSTVFTSKANDWKLIYYECFTSKKDALTEEKFLKTGKGRERLKFLLENTMISLNE